MHPPRMSALSCIVPPTEQLVIRTHIVPLLPTFHGMESENPYTHDLFPIGVSADSYPLNGP